MTFDVNTFLNTPISGANSTALTPAPEGEYLAMVSGEVKARQFEGKDGGQAAVLDINWSIDDNAVTSVTGRQPTVVRQSLFLDLTPNGALDMSEGKNVGLGRLREALGMNVPGQPFSFAAIPGKMARVRVKHRLDKEDSTRIYDEVKSIAAA